MSTQALQTIELRPTGGLALRPDDVKTRVEHITKIAMSVMRPDVHYGKIPGTDKPSLLKPGAELLCMTFQLSPSYDVEDLSENDAISYRVTCKIYGSGNVFLGAGVATCSSDETKYKWRKPVCDAEFDETPPNRRREKWMGGRSPWKAKQVRTEPADVENTVLKMAAKRALIAATLQVTAASEVFTQDVEDMPQELREAMHEAAHGERPTAGTPAPGAQSGEQPATDSRRKRADGRPMTSKYESKCNTCRDGITPGDKILYFSADKSAAHDRCILE
jgi:hypothetical protein